MFKLITSHYSHYSIIGSTTRTISQISMNISMFPLLKGDGKPDVITSKEPMKFRLVKASILTQHSSMKHSMVNGTAKTPGHPLLSGQDTENGEPKYKSATEYNIQYNINITHQPKETKMASIKTLNSNINSLVHNGIMTQDEAEELLMHVHSIWPNRLYEEIDP